MGASGPALGLGRGRGTRRGSSSHACRDSSPSPWQLRAHAAWARSRAGRGGGSHVAAPRGTARPPPRPAASDAERLLPPAALGSSCAYITPSCRSGGEGGAGTPAKARTWYLARPGSSERTQLTRNGSERFPSSLGGSASWHRGGRGKRDTVPSMGSRGWSQSQAPGLLAGAVRDSACGPEVTDMGTAGCFRTRPCWSRTCGAPVR